MSSICSLGCAPSSVLVSGNRALGPLDRAEQPLPDKCSEALGWVSVVRPAAPVGAPKESAERVGFPKGLSAQRLLKEVPTPHLWGLRQEKSGAHIRLQMVLCNPSAPKPSWWGFPKVGQYMCGWGGVKKRRWAPRLPQCQVTRGFCA